METSTGSLYKALRYSQTSAKQNEHETSWKDEEVVEIEVICHKRCHAKNKKTRVRRPPRSEKRAPHPINSIKLPQISFLKTPVPIFQHISKTGVKSLTILIYGPSGRIPSLAG
ncbi:hypothetical protein FB451DRAFT_1177105 [Mycena latifolia]|nr:hypothetical protein FB451DRAFT_1177105 [Mycena latifolia]